MPPVKSFPVLGEWVEILVSGEMTGGQSVTLIQTSPPGGGPPPHQHEHEDETFYVLEGDYEILKDGAWVKAAAGRRAACQARFDAHLSQHWNQHGQNPGTRGAGYV